MSQHITLVVTKSELSQHLVILKTSGRDLLVLPVTRMLRKKRLDVRVYLQPSEGSYEGGLDIRYIVKL